MESNPKMLLRSDAVAGRNGDEGDSDEERVVGGLAIEFPTPTLLFGNIPEFNWTLPFVIEDAKRDKFGVLHGEGEVWRLSLGSDPFVMILLKWQK